MSHAKHIFKREVKHKSKPPGGINMCSSCFHLMVFLRYFPFKFIPKEYLHNFIPLQICQKRAKREREREREREDTHSLIKNDKNSIIHHDYPKSIVSSVIFFSIEFPLQCTQMVYSENFVPPGIKHSFNIFQLFRSQSNSSFSEKCDKRFITFAPQVNSIKSMEK